MKKTLNPLENARRTAGISGGGGGGGISNATLSLNHNTDNDPIINLEYEEAGATLSSPVAFDKSDFYVSNNHMKVEGLDVLKTDVDELSDGYNELDTKVSGLSDQISGVSSQVGTIESRLDVHTIGTAITCKSNTSSNPFNVPSDGYIQCVSNSASNKCRLKSGTFTLLEFVNSPIVIMVKKGMIVHFENNSNISVGDFLPLI